MMSIDLFQNIDLDIAKKFVDAIFIEERSYSKTEELTDILIYLMKNKYIDQISESNLEILVQNANDDIEDINSIIELIYYLNINNEYITDNLNEKTTSYIEYRLEEASNDIDIGEYINYVYDYIDVDQSSIESVLIDAANDLEYDIMENDFIKIDTESYGE